ncbi:Uncharacterized protein TCM_027356 [Theobroma cacao]|uniref:Uncharacterized protein n=1 Tax=Theobroma cacao TaxID=3641 RepID=A0A061G7X4_THECC|nr:Uncharacterized protein TCM_027356 [Theobroma cacao]
MEMVDICCGHNFITNYKFLNHHIFFPIVAKAKNSYFIMECVIQVCFLDTQLMAPPLKMYHKKVLYLGNNCTTVIFKPPRTATYIIRTTLGARSMLKMLLDAAGGIVITIDGNAILRELDLAHPAAKAQYPTMLLYFIFFRSYNNALEDTIAVLDKIAMPTGVKDHMFSLQFFP